MSECIDSIAFPTVFSIGNLIILITMLWCPTDAIKTLFWITWVQFSCRSFRQSLELSQKNSEQLRFNLNMHMNHSKLMFPTPWLTSLCTITSLESCINPPLSRDQHLVNTCYMRTHYIAMQCFVLIILVLILIQTPANRTERTDYNPVSVPDDNIWSNQDQN